MKQMDLLGNYDHLRDKQPELWQLFIDGASKGNPGHAGCGFVLMKNKEIICQQGYYLGIKTNNQAEYYGLLLGVFFAKKYVMPSDVITIISDSQLLVRQINGIYRVKNDGLLQLKNLALRLLQGYIINVEHVLREHNKRADEMANRGVEKKIILPQEFLQLLHQHGIFL